MVKPAITGNNIEAVAVLDVTNSAVAGMGDGFTEL